MNDIFSNSTYRAQGSLKKIAPFILLLLALFIYLPGTPHLPLLDRDEPRFSEATVEMMDRGDWIVPYFNEDYRFDKPVFVYWLMRASYTLFGVNEFAARLHSVASVYLVALTIFCIGLRFFTAQSGLLAGIAWLTCLQALIHGRIAVADMPMIAFVALAHWGLMELLLRDNRRPWSPYFWLTWISLGLGFLTKGPIALLVPLFTVLGFRFVFRKKELRFKQLQIVPGVALLLLIIASWGIPALIVTKGAFWNIGMGTHVVDRGLDAFNGRVPFPGYYFITAFFSLFPWIAFAWRAFRNSKQPFDPLSAFLLAWLLNPYLIFLFYKTQLPHYVMPGFAAFFLLLFRHDFVDWTKGEKRWYFLVMALWGLILVALIAAGIAFPFSGRLLPLSRVLVALIVLLAAMYCIALALFYGWKIFGRTDLLLASCVILIAGSFQIASSSLREVNATIAVCGQIQGLDKDAEKYAYGFTEPSLVFYTGAGWNFNPPLKAKQLLQQKTGSPELILMLKKEWKIDRYINRMSKGEDPFLPSKDNSEQVNAISAEALTKGYRMSTVSGVNLGSSSWVELVLLRAGGHH